MPKTVTAPASTLTVDAIIGRNVRAELSRHGITQGDAATELDLSRNALVERLTGRTGFRAAELQRLGLRIGVPVDAFYAGTHVPTDRQAGHARAGFAAALALGLACALVLHALLVAWGQYVVWLAGVDDATGYAFGLAALAVPFLLGYALLSLRDHLRARRRAAEAAWLRRQNTLDRIERSGALTP